jgi:hypothetical protein
MFQKHLVLLLVFGLSLMVVSQAGAQSNVSGASSSATAQGVANAANNFIAGQSTGIYIEHGGSFFPASNTASGSPDDPYHTSSHGVVDSNSHSKIDAGNSYRQFPNAAEITYPGMPSYFGETPGRPLFQPVEDLLKYRPYWFTVADLQQLIASDNMKVTVTSHYGLEMIDDAKMVKVLRNGELKAAEKENRIMKTCTVLVRAKDLEADSATCFYQALLTAAKNKANAVVISGEGTVRKVVTKGWGIGVNTSGATLNGNGELGTITSGGTGWSKGKAGNVDLPWIRIHGVKVDGLENTAKGESYYRHLQLKGVTEKQTAKRSVTDFQVQLASSEKKLLHAF